MDFDEEQDHVVTDSSKGNEDVEVQHTIVVSTKLKNNNRRLQNFRDGEYNLLVHIFAFLFLLLLNGCKQDTLLM